MSRKPSESDASVAVQETVQETEEEDDEAEDEASEGKEVSLGKGDGRS